MLNQLRRRVRDRKSRRAGQKHAIFVLRQRQQREVSRLRFYQDGFNARKAGKPCAPPGYPPPKDFYPEEQDWYDMRYQAWAEGWNAADAAG